MESIRARVEAASDGPFGVGLTRVGSVEWDAVFKLGGDRLAMVDGAGNAALFASAKDDMWSLLAWLAHVEGLLAEAAPTIDNGAAGHRPTLCDCVRCRIRAALPRKA